MCVSLFSGSCVYLSQKIAQHCYRSMCTQQRGLAAIYYMRLYCYRTCAAIAVQEQIWLFSEYVHALAVEPYAEFYIREDRVCMARILDPLMVHVRTKDLIL
jgi:hypothetical protein